jgi:hypothetical protein
MALHYTAVELAVITAVVPLVEEAARRAKMARAVLLVLALVELATTELVAQGRLNQHPQQKIMALLALNGLRQIPGMGQLTLEQRPQEVLAAAGVGQVQHKAMVVLAALTALVGQAVAATQADRVEMAQMA